MSVLPLRTLCLSVRFSSPTPSIDGLLAVGCELPLPLGPFPGTLMRLVKLKSFVCNAYKKHGGVGCHVRFFALHSSSLTSATRRNSRNSNPFICLLPNSRTPGVGGALCGRLRSCSLHQRPADCHRRPKPVPSLRLSTVNFRPLPRVTSHQSRVTPYEPAHL